MKISDNGLYFIAQLETPNGKPILKAYESVESNKDGSVKYEIGFGHNSDSFFKVEKDTVITEKKAYELLAHDVDEVAEVLNKFMERHQLKFRQYQFDALISAMYNGVPCTRASTGIHKAVIKAGKIWIAVREVKEADDSYRKYGWLDLEHEEKIKRIKNVCNNEIVRELNRWIYITVGKEKARSRGLKNRRAAECELFVHGKYPKQSSTELFSFITLSGE